MNINEINSVLGEWQIDSLIGEGSFGKVYRVKKSVLGDTYYAAVKVISIPQSESEISDILASGESEDTLQTYFKSIIEEWNMEFRMLEKLKGVTNIVGVEDYLIIENDDKIHWNIIIRMEYLTPFNKYILTNPIRVSDALKIGIDICKGLEYCEHQMIIHRDIKPENIFVSKFGDFKLGDFGIARQLDKSSTNLSKKGTNLYMAPEVYKGESYSGTVDSYSLGLVLYRLFNRNKLPFIPLDSATTKYFEREASIIQRMKGAEFPKPAEATDAISRIILKACSYNAGLRYTNATALKNDLQKELTLLVEKDDHILINLGIPKVADPVLATNNFIYDDATEILLKDIHTGSDSRNTGKMSGSEGKTAPVMAMNQSEPAVAKSKESDENPQLTDNRQQGGRAGNAEISDSYGDKNVPQATAGKDPVRKTDSAKNVADNAKTAKIEPLKTTKESKRRNNKALYLAILIIVVVGSLYAFMMLNGKDTTSTGKMIAVPNILEMSSEEAVKELERVGFVVMIVKATDNTLEPGKVIKQSVESAKKVKIGSEITITVTVKGSFEMPSVVNMNKDEAKTKLELLGAKVTIVELVNDSGKENIVTNQSIVEKSTVEAGEEVKITVIIHSPSVTVPSLINMDIANAKTALDGLGIKYTLKPVINDSKVAGLVFSQSVAKNTQIDKGSNIAVSFYVKSEKVTVPSWTATSASSYKTKLSSLKLEPSVTEKFSDTVATGAIISVSPTSGTVVNVGTSITIIVSKGKSQFSGWALTLPAGITEANSIIESKSQYQYRDMKFTTSSESTLAGWIKYDETFVWSAWSSWSTTSVSATSNMAVETQVIETKNYKTVYYYNRWYYFNSSANSWYASYTQYTGSGYLAGSGKWQYYQQDNVPLGLTGQAPSGNIKYIGDWYNQTSGSVYVNSSYSTEYRFQTKVFTYKFQKWGDFSPWQDQAVENIANREIMKQTLFRYRSR